jgi:hypothetical protein
MVASLRIGFRAIARHVRFAPIADIQRCPSYVSLGNSIEPRSLNTLLAKLSHFDANGVSLEFIRAGMRGKSMRGRPKASSFPARLWLHRHTVDRNERMALPPCSAKRHQRAVLDWTCRASRQKTAQVQFEIRATLGVVLSFTYSGFPVEFGEIPKPFFWRKTHPLGIAGVVAHGPSG